MCGITGWVDFSRDMTREREVIDAMTETMACRGPDATGVWSDQNVALGHRRASRNRHPRRLPADVGVHTQRRRRDGVQR